MRGLSDLVSEFPWQTVAGAFVLGALCAADRRTRNTVFRAGLEIGRLAAVQRARVWLAPQDAVVTR